MTVETINYYDFVNKELILFSMADLARSIPSMVDGLKPGQRKILFCCFKRNFVTQAKVNFFCLMKLDYVSHVIIMSFPFFIKTDFVSHFCPKMCLLNMRTMGLSLYRLHNFLVTCLNIQRTIMVRRV
jgi:hypothetical protein